MKMTLEVDEKKLSLLMKLTGIATKTAAVDYALRTAERTARREKLFTSRWELERLSSAIDPG